MFLVVVQMGRLQRWVKTMVVVRPCACAISWAPLEKLATPTRRSATADQALAVPSATVVFPDIGGSLVGRPTFSKGAGVRIKIQMGKSGAIIKHLLILAG